MATIRPRPGILEIEPYVGGKAELAGIARIAKLSANESALGPSERAVAAAVQASQELHRYPDGGALDLRRALGRRFDLDPARIVAGAGSDELLQLLMKAYAGPGDEVISSAHGFLMYKLTALAVGATPVAVPEVGLRTDVDAVLRAVTSRTRMVFLANPNNPTGSYLTAAEMAALHAGLPDDVFLVIDAAYAEYVQRNDYDSGRALVDAADNVIMTRTFSKLFALAALRLGWTYAPAHVVDVLNRIRGPFNVNRVAQLAGIAALEDEGHQARSRDHNATWLPWLTAEIGRLGPTVHPSVGNFVLIEFPKTPGRDAQGASAWLERQGIIARAMGAYGLPHCLRLSIGTEAENRRVVEALAGFAG